MKKTFLFPAIIAAFTSLFLNSCVETSENPPLIYATVVGTPTYEPGSTVQYKIDVSTSNGDLKTLTAQGTGSVQPGSGSGVNYTAPANKWDYFKNEFVSGTVSVTVYYNIVIGSDLDAGREFSIRFEVTDEKSQFANQEVSITVGGGSSVTEMVTAGTSCQIFNYLSTKKSGWDMVNDVQVSGTDNTKDIWNHTQVGDADWNDTYGFTPSFWTSNGTILVKASGLNYETAKLSDVMNAYTAGTQLSYVKVNNGDIFVARLRGSNTYAILKVTAIGYVQKAPQDDYLQFDYKKASYTPSK